MKHYPMKGILALVCVSLGMSGTGASADSGLIREVEGLRNELPLRDSSRPALTLRLADLVFDEAGEVSKNPSLTEAQLKTVSEYRKKAAQLYRQALTGDGGTFPSPTGALRTKLQFQLARLHADLSQVEAANALWTELVAQNQIPEIQREAALRLAEYNENQESVNAAQQADRFYQLALQLCAGGDTCSYAHYRRAWLHHRADRQPQAIAEMKLALTDSKGQTREEAVRDLILFHSKVPGDGKEALFDIDELAQKLSRPALLTDLADADYAAGNKVAGTWVLEQVNRRTPHLKFQARLLEENYGARNWDRFHELLEQVSRASPADLASMDQATQVEVEKILRRMTVQLDGERISQKQFVAEFQSAVLAYLRIFPRGPTRASMVDGWLAAETDPARKLAQLKDWIGEEMLQPSHAKELIQLRETRASVAQKSAQWEIVIEEMAALAAFAPAAGKSREYRYLGARAMYEKKDYGAALPIFQGLALADPGAALGEAKYGVESENLALDILGLQKKFAEVEVQADAWLKHPHPSPKIASELGDIRRIAEGARFERAATLGRSPEALTLFLGFCSEKKFLPKSCENAKVLAIQLKNQDALIGLLKSQGMSGELAAEYEASGQFSLAAETLERSATRTSPQGEAELLKIALLYELGNRYADRDRLLRGLTTVWSKQKSLGEREALIYISLKDAKLLSAGSLKLPWKSDNRLKIAHELELSGQGTRETHQLMLGSRQSLGEAWSKAVLAELSGLDAAQAKIDFYGKNGQRKFEARLSAIRKLVGKADFYLEGADTVTRVRIASLLRVSHQRIADLILASPIPSSVEGAALEQVKLSLTQLAVPFQEKAQAYGKLAQEQMAKISDPAIHDEIAAQQASSNREYQVAADRKPEETRAPAATVDPAERDAALQALRTDPSDEHALRSLKTYYEKRGEHRLASYFEGRLLSVKKEGNGS